VKGNETKKRRKTRGVLEHYHCATDTEGNSQRKNEIFSAGHAGAAYYATVNGAPFNEGGAGEEPAVPAGVYATVRGVLSLIRNGLFDGGLTSRSVPIGVMVRSGSPNSSGSRPSSVGSENDVGDGGLFGRTSTVVGPVSRLPAIAEVPAAQATRDNPSDGVGASQTAVIDNRYGQQTYAERYQRALRLSVTQCREEGADDVRRRR
jgi:hypothetical protein